MPIERKHLFIRLEISAFISEMITERTWKINYHTRVIKFSNFLRDPSRISE